MRAFTLIEILLYLTITSIIMLSLTVFFGFLMSSKLKNQSITEVDQQGAQIMQEITRTIRNARKIKSPAAGEIADSLHLQTNNILQNPTIFSSQDSVLQLQEGRQKTLSLSSKKVEISDLSFQNLSSTNAPGIVRIKYTLSHVNPENRNERKYSNTFIGSASLK